jgi:hypothetical protein
VNSSLQPLGVAPGGPPSPLKVAQRSIVVTAAFGLAIIATVMGGVALARSWPGATSPSSSLPAKSAGPSADEVAVAKMEACAAWRAAAIAMNVARRPFVDSPAARDDPITANALAQSEAAIAIQVAYVRQHIPAATPPDVAMPIGQYLAGMIDTAAADGQPGADAAANAAAARAAAAATKIKGACGA